MNQEDLIQKYLNNQMSKEEAAAFEQQMKHDDDLSDKVFLKKDLNNFFNDFRPDVVMSLNALGSDFFDEKTIDTEIDTETIKAIPKKDRKIIYIIIGVISLAIILGAYYFYTSSNAIQNKQVEPTNEIITPTIEEEKIEELDKTPPKEPTQISTENQPIAEIDQSLYRPNDMLEGFLNESSRSNNNSQLISPTVNKTFFGKNIQLDIQGFSTERPPYELKIYANKSTDFENDKYLTKMSVPTKETDGKYDFRFLSNLKLDKGLYYILIKKEESDQVILVSKFRVK